MSKARAVSSVFLLTMLAGIGLYLYQPVETTSDLVRVPRINLTERDNWFWQQRAYPIGGIPERARLDAMRESERKQPANLSPATMAAAGAQWTQLGPAGFDSMVEPTWGRQSGRTRAFLVDPNDSNRLFLGAATGGVWRSTDGGTTWTPITDDQPSLSVGSLAMDPQNSNTIYVGTGEGPAGAYYSVGILKSTDGGNTWTQLAEDTFARHAIAEILVSPTDSDVVLACATNGSHQPGDAIAREEAKSGIFRSTDGGMTFTQVRTGSCQDLIASPASFNNQFASITEAAGVGVFGEDDGLYRSTDGGQTWNAITTDGAPFETPRLNIGISADGMTLYAGGKDNNNQTTIWKSTDGGDNWMALPNTPDYCESQCGYDNDVVVSPANADHVYFAGIPFFRTLNGGTSFDQLGASNDSQPRGSLHVDHHILYFDPSNSDTLYLGNDGGIYRSTNISTPGDVANPGPTWTPLTGTSIGTIQFYDLQVHPTDPEVMLGGVQDNGTQVRAAATGRVWTEQCGGDGSSALIDHSSPNIMYCSFAFTGGGSVGILRSEDSGASFPDDRSLNIGQERTSFITPLAMHPTTSTTLYAGTQRLWRTTDAGQNWSPIGPDDLTMGEGTISALEISPSNPMVIWATTSDGQVQVSSDGGNTFTNQTRAPLPGRFATSVAIHPTDPNTAYVGFSGFDDGTPGAPGHIFQTTDGGATWANVTANLPDIPVNHIAINPANTSSVYAGTDIGVYFSDGGAGSALGASPAGDAETSGAAAVNWVKFTGLPNAGVIKIRVNTNTSRLVVATYGRSVWSTPLTAGGGSFLYFPYVVGDAQNFTGIAFTFNGNGTADLSLEARAADGSLQGYPQNPAMEQVAANRQIARLARQFFQIPSGTQQDGWIRVGTSSSGVASFFQFGNGLGGPMTRLDGGVAVSSQSQRLYFTRLYDGMGSFPVSEGALDATTILALANPNDTAITVTVRLFDADGNQVGNDVMRQINGLGCLLESVSSLFGQGTVSDGFVRADVTEGSGVVGFELVQLPDTVLGFNASTGNSETTAFSAQLANGTSGGTPIATSAKLVNTSDSVRMVTLTGLNEAGAMLGETNVELGPNESFQMDLGQALSLGPVTGAAVAGSLRVVADGDGIIGDVVFGEATQARFAAALAIQTQLLRSAIFNHVANLSTGSNRTSSFTGLAFHNPQSEEAEITIRVFTADSQEVGSRTINLAAGSRISEVLTTLIPDSQGQAGGYITVTSTQPVVAQQLFGNLTLDYLSAVPPTIF